MSVDKWWEYTRQNGIDIIIKFKVYLELWIFWLSWKLLLWNHFLRLQQIVNNDKDCVDLLPLFTIAKRQLVFAFTFVLMMGQVILWFETLT